MIMRPSLQFPDRIHPFIWLLKLTIVMLRPNSITSICGGFVAQKSTTNRSNGVWANSLIRFILMLQVSMVLTQMNRSKLTLWPWSFDRTIGTCGTSWSQNYYKLWKQSYPPIYHLRRIMSLSCMRSGDILTSDLCHQLFVWATHRFGLFRAPQSP